MAGFQVARTQSNGDYTGKQETFAVAAAHSTLLATGDVVKITGSADAEGRQSVDTGATTVANTGVIMSVDFILEGEQLSETGLPALTAGTVKVNLDQGLLYEVEVANGPLVLADVGLNVPTVVTAATKSGGLTVSNMTVNATGKATTQTLPWRVVSLLKGETSGVLGDRALVRPNATTFSDGAAGI